MLKKTNLVVLLLVISKSAYGWLDPAAIDVDVVAAPLGGQHAGHLHDARLRGIVGKVP